MQSANTMQFVKNPDTQGGSNVLGPICARIPANGPIAQLDAAPPWYRQVLLSPTCSAAFRASSWRSAADRWKGHRDAVVLKCLADRTRGALNGLDRVYAIEPGVFRHRRNSRF